MTQIETIKVHVDELAKKHNFLLIDWQPKTATVIYTNGVEKVNVYLTKMTVATCIKHPKKGKTQLFRRNVSFVELEQIFADPRTHTGKGYYKKPKTK